jgi:hypothetical protein
MLLQGPIVPTLLRMAWPNVLIMFGQAATGLIETYWVGYLGTDALAGMALVFPGVMLMQMFSAGAMGGGISSAIARALGAGKRDQADALVLHALVINLAIGAAFTAAVLLFGRPLYRLLGGEGASLEGRADLLQIVFGGIVLLWLMNATRERDPRPPATCSFRRWSSAPAHRAGAALTAADLRRRPDPGNGYRGRRLGARALQSVRRAGARLVRALGPQHRALRIVPLRWSTRARSCASARSRRQHGADQRHGRGDTALVGLAAGTGGGRGLRHGGAARVSARAAGVRHRRAAGGAGRHQYRRGQSRACAARRLDRGGARLRAVRDRSASRRRCFPPRGSACSATTRR